MATIALLGTLDTKLSEFLKLRECLFAIGADNVILIDAGRSETKHDAITITQPEVLKYASSLTNAPDFSNGVRGDIVGHMAACAMACAKHLSDSAQVHGIISAGGSGGTTLATQAMRGLPLGFPKVMVSTVGSGDISPYVGETDICMMYSVVDVAGWNGMLSKVFSNAAGAVVGMANSFRSRRGKEEDDGKQKRRIGITMFGVTTPCVEMVQSKLSRDGENELYVFHATGHGGQAMERLVEAEELDAVIDLTTTEICDHFSGGNMSAGPHRLEAALKRGIPSVISVGACDMVNFGPKHTVPEKYKGRKLYEHNATVTLMRTTPGDCRQIASFICAKVKTHAKRESAVKIILPEGGVSLISTPGQAFEDRDADNALFGTIRDAFAGTGVECINRKEAINDEAFASAVVEALAHIDPA